MKAIIVNIFLGIFFYSTAMAGEITWSAQGKKLLAPTEDVGMFVKGVRVSVEDGVRVLTQKLDTRSLGGSKYPVFDTRGVLGEMNAAKPNDFPPIPENLDKFPILNKIDLLHRKSGKYANVKVGFKFNDYHLSHEGENLLTELVHRVANLDDDEIIIITGHTDSNGPASYNKDLSMRRAQSVAHYLKLMNPSLDTHLYVAGMGEMQLIIKNGHEDPAASRRVQLDMASRPY